MTVSPAICPAHGSRLSHGIRGVLPTLILAISGSLRADDTPEANPRMIAVVDRVVERQGIAANEPGVAIWVHQPGRLRLQKGYGLANLKTVRPITPRTNFELASLSKTITATAVLILHDRGKLSIDDDLRKVLPRLTKFHPEKPIHVRDLLRHVSGLPDYMGLNDVPKRHEDYWDNDDYVGAFATRGKRLKLDFPADSKYEYNNTNYFLLASVVAHVSGKSFGQFAREEIFQPSGMEHTFVYESPAAVPAITAGRDRALGYEWNQKKAVWKEAWGTPPARQESMLVVGDGSVWSSLEDLARWDAVVRERKLLKPETWKQALTPHTTKDGKTNDYGLGWGLYFTQSRELYGYGHDGSWGGFQTSYYRYLTKDRSTVILSNRGTLDTDKLWEALDAALDQPAARK